MSIVPIGAAIPPVSVGATSPADGFGQSVSNALQTVSQAEHQADSLAQEIATGGDVPIHELMVATTKAQLSVDVLVQVRNRAVEAYQEVMRMQI